MTSPLPPDAAGPFGALVAELDTFAWRPEVEVERIGSPQRIAPHSAAVAAEVVEAGEDVGNGRFVLLHDPQGNEAWQGEFRCVTFVRADVGHEMASDPLLAEVGWSWLTDALARHGARHVAASGTVTSVASRSFGGMEDEPDTAEVEIRASWTPLLDGAHSLAAHLAAWQELLCTTAGLPELPEGVVLLGSRMGRGR